MIYLQRVKMFLTRLRLLNDRDCQQLMKCRGG
uniref:Uncharacterized protein n=1 Tax=Arundo donax TaxID=35708 RepID=A0A0A9C4U1_ARUDO